MLRDGRKTEIPAVEVVPGDILLLEAGDLTAADGRIIKSHSLQVNESSLTGESTNVEKVEDTLTGECALGDRKNMVLLRQPCNLWACGGRCDRNRNGYGNRTYRRTDEQCEERKHRCRNHWMISVKSLRHSHSWYLVAIVCLDSDGLPRYAFGGAL